MPWLTITGLTLALENYSSFLIQEALLIRVKACEPYMVLASLFSFIDEVFTKKSS